MADFENIAWRCIVEEAKKDLDAIAEMINATKPMVSRYTTCQLTRMPKEAEHNQIYLGVLMGYLIAKIEGPERHLGLCKLGDDGEFYVSWTTGETDSARSAA